MEVVRRALMEGKCSVPEVGAVAAGTARDLPFVLVDADGCEVEPVSAYLRDLILGDVSPLTCRSYGFGLLRWHRLLWFLQVPWDWTTEAEVAALVGWLREVRNPQRLRKRNGASPPPGSVNLKTGKPSLREGYAPSTINHNLSVVSGFYAFHARFGAGPVVNPVTASRGRRDALAHRSPLEPTPVFRRGRLRQKVPVQAPRSIPDHLWDELFAGMGCDRDRALLEFYVCWWYTPSVASDVRQKMEPSTAGPSWSAPGPDLGTWVAVLACECCGTAWHMSLKPSSGVYVVQVGSVCPVQGLVVQERRGCW